MHIHMILEVLRAIPSRPQCRQEGARNVLRPAATSVLRCARSARRSRSTRTSKSPRAWAALSTPKVYFRPDTGKSTASSHDPVDACTPPLVTPRNHMLLIRRCYAVGSVTDGGPNVLGNRLQIRR